MNILGWLLKGGEAEAEAREGFVCSEVSDDGMSAKVGGKVAAKHGGNGSRRHGRRPCRYMSYLDVQSVCVRVRVCVEV